MTQPWSAQLDPWLDQHGCRALLVCADTSTDPWLAPFVGAARLGTCFLIAPRDGTPRLAYLSPMERDEAAASGVELLTPDDLDVQRWARDNASYEEIVAESIAQGLSHCGVAPGRLAIAGRLSAGQVLGVCRDLETDGWHFVAAEEILRRMRRAKSDDDLAEIRRVSAVVEAAFRDVAARLASAAIAADGTLHSADRPLTVGTLRRAIARRFAEHELRQPERNIIGPAEEGAVPHTTGTDDRVLRAGETLIVDLFPKGRLFTDCTRTFCVDEPPEVVTRAHRDVVDALVLAESNARAGIEGWSLQEDVCHLLDERGWPTPISEPSAERGYVHGLGHGVGYALHENPSFREFQFDEGRLIENDVITLEPGLYDPEAGWGIRVEDLYRVTADGVEPLTTLPRGLDPRSW
ncbi:MAG: M24 family metallopeptidase [Acidobacteriota bacterium]